MKAETYRDELVLKMEEYIEEYDKIILLKENKISNIQLSQAFCCSNILKKIDKKVLLLSVSVLEEPKAESVVVKQITENECQNIMKLYSIYDFSDRFLILSTDNSYGDLFNFAKTGLITMEEAFQAFLN